MTADPENSDSTRRLALKLRLLGWALFLGGFSITLFLGKLTLNNEVTWIGVFITISGMICTSACNVIASYADLQKRKRENDPVEPLTPDSAEKAKKIIRERKENL